MLQRCTPQAFGLTKKEYFKELFIGLLLCGLYGFLFYNSPAGCLLLSPYLYFYVKEAAEELSAKKKRGTEKKFTDGLTSVSCALDAGYSMDRAFAEAAHELKNLYGARDFVTREFVNVDVQVRRAIRLEIAIAEMAEHLDIQEAMDFALVFQYARRTGGNLIAIVRSYAKHLSERQEVEDEIQTVLSGRLFEQKVLRAMPVALVAFLRLSSPEFLAPLYGNVMGVLVMSVCLVVLFLASAFGRRIGRIEV